MKRFRTLRGVLEASPDEFLRRLKGLGFSFADEGLIEEHDFLNIRKRGKAFL